MNYCLNYWQSLYATHRVFLILENKRERYSRLLDTHYSAAKLKNP